MSRLSVNDKVDNEMKPGSVHKSPCISLTAVENPGKPQLYSLEYLIALVGGFITVDEEVATNRMTTVFSSYIIYSQKTILYRKLKLCSLESVLYVLLRLSKFHIFRCYLINFFGFSGSSTVCV